MKVRVAPRTTELLIERGEYVPGQGVPLFELRPPIFAGADWATKRVFDVVVGALIVVVGLPVWLLIALAIKLDLARPGALRRRARSGSASSAFRMLKFRTMVRGRRRAARTTLERANEASGALFKIRDDPRVTRVGRFLRRLLARRDAERAQRAARRDVARRPAAAAAPRLRAARAVAPPALQRPARA